METKYSIAHIFKSLHGFLMHNIWECLKYFCRLAAWLAVWMARYFMGLDIKIKGIGFLTLADVDVRLGPDLHVVCHAFKYYCNYQFDEQLGNVLSWTFSVDLYSYGLQSKTVTLAILIISMSSRRIELCKNCCGDVIMFYVGNKRCCIVLYCIVLHCIALRCVALRCIVL